MLAEIDEDSGDTNPGCDGTLPMIPVEKVDSMPISGRAVAGSPTGLATVALWGIWSACDRWEATFVVMGLLERLGDV